MWISLFPQLEFSSFRCDAFRKRRSCFSVPQAATFLVPPSTPAPKHSGNARDDCDPAAAEVFQAALFAAPWPKVQDHFLIVQEIPAHGLFDTGLRTRLDPTPGQYTIKFPSKKPARGYGLPSFSLQDRVRNSSSFPNLVRDEEEVPVESDGAAGVRVCHFGFTRRGGDLLSQHGCVH